MADVAVCNGSLDEPGERPGPDGKPFTARCSACGHFVEIHPVEPGVGPEVWRLEMHDTTGRTIRLP